jgi:DNA-binding LytR/AlgR family response regulator
MNCLIVDDELLAQDVLALYISRLDFLTLSGRCNNALQAFAALNQTPVDLLFLDIKMPEMNGLDLLKNLKHPPKVILTTAYDTYALEGYELDVVDYLLKPIRFERFLKAIQKVQQPATAPAAQQPPLPVDEPFYVRSDRKLVRIDPGEVLYVESLKNYLAIHTPGQKVIVYATLSQIGEELQRNPCFVQVHKSFIVNTRFVAEVRNSMILLKDHTELPVGNHYRDALLQALRIFNA